MAGAAEPEGRSGAEGHASPFEQHGGRAVTEAGCAKVQPRDRRRLTGAVAHLGRFALQDIVEEAPVALAPRDEGVEQSRAHVRAVACASSPRWLVPCSADMSIPSSSSVAGVPATTSAAGRATRSQPLLADISLPTLGTSPMPDDARSRERVPGA